MKRPSLRSQKATALLAIAAALMFVYAPSAFGFSSGITKDNAGVAEFEELGCTACHGPGAAGHHDFAAGSPVTWTIRDAEGNGPEGNAYAHGTEYTITLTLNETNEPTADNRAGFNLRASVGSFTGVEGSSKTSEDGTQATHVNAGAAEWSVLWTSPDADAGPAIFDLFVNDVDGSTAPDAGDAVYRTGWFLTDTTHAQPGAAQEHEVHYGVSLPQYWLGLIALAMMIVIMLFGFVYMKYVNPHNTDQKDR